MKAASVILFATIALVNCSKAPQPAPAPVDAPAKTAIAEHGSVDRSRTLGGFIAPSANVSITSSLAEPAAEVDVVEGQHVRLGQTIAVLDVSDLRAEYDADVHAANEADANASKQFYAGAQTIGSGDSNVANANSALSQGRERERLDRINLARDADLLRQGFIARQTYDAQLATVEEDTAATHSAVAALAAARLTASTNGSQDSGLQGASLESAREAAGQARATARQIAASIARATIVAPVSGVVTNRNLNPGEYPGTRTLFTIQAIDVAYAPLNASSEQVAGVAIGDPATIAVRGTSRRISGHVTALLGEAAPGSTNFTVKVGLDDRSGALLAGTAVEASIDLPAIRGTVVPRTALDADETQTGIVRDGRYRTVPVSVVAEDATNAVVMGIEPGTRVVTEGFDLEDGQRVAVR